MQHYYSPKQESKYKIKKIKIDIIGFSFSFYTSSGIFSKKKIDLGTKLLAENMIVKGKTLDIGCGYGVIGIVASKFAKEVYLTDINERACKLANMNLKLNNIKNAVVKNGNLYEPVKNIKFDTILCNPPQTAGKDICFKIIKQAKVHLNKNGLFELVARHKKGGKSLALMMKETFNNIEVIAKGSGYKIYLSKNES